MNIIYDLLLEARKNGWHMRECVCAIALDGPITGSFADWVAGRTYYLTHDQQMRLCRMTQDDAVMLMLTRHIRTELAP